MVRGLKIFADYFTGYEDRYVLIGGAACDIWLSKADGARSWRADSAQGSSVR